MSISSRTVLSFVALASCLLPLAASAQTPQLINYQGRLLSGTNLVNGSVGLSLRLFDASAAGTLLYEDSNTVTVADGLYSTLIGDDTTFGTLQSALETTNVWVEVAVNDTALTPRERLVSAAYAVKSRATEVFTGAVTDGQLSTNVARLSGANQTFSGPVSFTSVSNAFAGTFSGNGTALTNVDAGTISGVGLTNLVQFSTRSVTSVYATAGLYTFTNVYSDLVVTAKLWGAGGGGASPGTGGGGAFVQVAFALTNQQVVTLLVGEGGGYQTNRGGLASGILNGGLTTNNSAGQGGQASLLCLSSGGQYVVQAIVGGGGGAGSSHSGGGGGNPGGGGVRASTNDFSAGTGGASGTGGAGGGTVLAGKTGSNVSSDVFLTGVSNLTSLGGAGGAGEYSTACGGGGGGWGGGGGGGYDGLFPGGGGGGGGSYGAIVIAGTNGAAGNAADSSYRSHAGRGGVTASSGSNGLVVLIYAGPTLPANDAAKLTNLDGGQLQASSVSGEKLAAGSVSNLHVAAGALSGDKLTSGTLSNALLAAGSVTGDKIADGSISNADIAATASITGNKLAAGTLSNANYAAASVTGDKIAGGTLSNVHLSAGAVMGDKISDGSISNADIAATAGITGNKLAIGTLSNAQFAAGAVTGDKVAAGTLSNANYAASSVTGDKIADGSISNADVAANTFWSTSGNAATTTNQFIGTTDSRSFEIRIKGGRALRLQPDNYDAGAPNFIGGSPANSISNNQVGSVIAGGGATNDPLDLGGSVPNSIISASYAAIGGGASNTIYSMYGVIAGGRGNTVSANSRSATIPGGEANVAGGQGAFAAGQNAQALHGGTFVWSDGQGASFASTAVNQFLIRAGGNVGINKNNPSNSLDVAGNVSASGTFYGDGTGLTLSTNIARLNAGTYPDARLSTNVALLNAGTYPDARLSSNIARLDTTQTFSAQQSIATGPGVRALQVVGDRSGTFGNALVYIENTNRGSASPALRVVGWSSNTGDDGALNVSANGAGRIARFGNSNAWVVVIDNAGNVGGLSFTPSSDRNAKENFADVDAQAILEKVAALPLARWNYKADAGTVHIGPMAQDFHAAFGVGPDDKHIATVDADGVALAAIQALKKDFDQQKAAKDAKIAELETQLGAVLERLRALEAAK